MYLNYIWTSKGYYSRAINLMHSGRRMTSEKFMEIPSGKTGTMIKGVRTYDNDRNNQQ